MDLTGANFAVGTKIVPNIIGGTFVLTPEITTGGGLEAYGITDACPTKTPAEVRPARIAVGPVSSTEGIALIIFDTGYVLPSNRCTTMELIYSEDSGEGDDLTADVNADLADGMGEGYATTGIAAWLAGAPVD